MIDPKHIEWAERSQKRQTIEAILRQHGVRPNYFAHARSVLMHCRDEAEMEAAINSLYRQPATRRWFF